MFSPGRRSGRPGEVRVTVSCGCRFMISDTTIQALYLIIKNFRVKHKLCSVHYSSSDTVRIILCPSAGATGVLTLRLTRAPVLHHTPPTQRVGITCTIDTVYTQRALLNRYLEHLQRGWGIMDNGLDSTCKL